MDFLFTPWRYAYVTTADQAPGCLFCRVVGHKNDQGGTVGAKNAEVQTTDDARKDSVRTGAAPSGESDAESQAQSDAKNMIVHRGQHCFVILNTFPYTSGHVMVVPYQHVDQLLKLPAPAAQEMMELTQKMEGILRELYRPDGLNLGMNLGKAAGAGVAGHIHMHVLPRWIADASFLSVVGETRILPEDLATTYRRIKEKF